MFHDERSHSIHIKKSNILNLIGFLQAMGFAIALFVVPLYLFQILKSGEEVGQIMAISAGFGILTTLLLSLLLGKVSRGVLFKISLFLCFISIITFAVFSNFMEALGARIMLTIGSIILASVLSLYIKSLSNKIELPKNQGFFQVSKNLAWSTGPIISGIIFNFVENNKEMVFEKLNFLPNFILGDIKYLEYSIPLLIGLIFLAVSFIVFLWAKFINNHPHLQDKKSHKEIDKHYHYSNFQFIFEYFKNKDRLFSFLNILFMGIWLSTFYSFGFTLFLENSEISKFQMGLFCGFISVPLFLIEGFIGKIIKKTGGIMNSLILGYSISVLFLTLGVLLGKENVYIFVIFFILSHIGIAIVEPLQELQYFKGVKSEDESKFYSIHMIGGGVFKLIAPFAFGLGITAFGVQNTFYSAPVILAIFLFILIFYKLKYDKS